MCGIYCSVHRRNASNIDNEFDCTKHLLQNRGPDGYSEISMDFLCWNIFFAGSTLWTQGSSIQIQPLVAPNGSVLLWNGDKYNEELSDDGSGINDSEEVFSNLLKFGIHYLMNINGPYAFVYFNVEDKELWFGRDVLGRHSLLWSLSKESLILSSVGLLSSETDVVTEVPYYALYKINLSSANLCLQVYPWFHIVVPKEIHVEIPFSIEECLRHKLLNFKMGEKWLDENPEDSEIIQYAGAVPEEIAYSIFQNALTKSYFMSVADKLEFLLFRSIEKRIRTQPKFCKNCLNTNEICKHPKIGILFSGGLDSAIVALIANSFVDAEEPIDLLNVSFQRTLNHKYDAVPDRINGSKTLQELKELCPNRVWNFIEINISQSELIQERERHISKLIYPLTSILDDSLGCALWFAARGKGLLDGQTYFSPTRVVLLGMGADEMFGGYTKHRKAFATGGWKCLGKELCETLSLIGERNLGRDNRVVADHGRQPRTPYLDEEFVAFVNSLPPWQRCFLPPHLPVGVGDKFALRLLAWKLGLRHAAVLPKKALQFGSHIANPKEKGHLTSERLSHTSTSNF